MEDTMVTLFTEIEADKSGRSGILPGTQNRGFAVECEVCGDRYMVERLRPDRSHRRLCKHCRSVQGQRIGHQSFSTPDSTKAERIRANGLVNKRLRLGWFTKPSACSVCGQPHHRINLHHHDYSKPDQGHWLCPPCHGKAHHRPDYLNGFEPFVCYDRRGEREKPKPHGKGGRKGPMDPAIVAKIRELRGNKITPEQVDEMRRRSNAGERHSDIAPDYGVSKSTVGRLIRGVRVPSSPTPTEAR